MHWCRGCWCHQSFAFGSHGLKNCRPSIPFPFFFFSIQYKGRGKARASGLSKRIGSNSRPRATRFKKEKICFLLVLPATFEVLRTYGHCSICNKCFWESAMKVISNWLLAKWAGSVFSLKSILKHIILKIRKSVFIETWKYSFKQRWKWYWYIHSPKNNKCYW